jgi:Protein of unknown function (Hypoth_ymh)
MYVDLLQVKSSQMSRKHAKPKTTKTEFDKLKMSAEDRQNSALNLLFLLAQTYYKILESVVSYSNMFCALDLELNESYLWTITNLTNLLSNHNDLRDFPVKFEPVFPDLYPSTIQDAEWQDMVGPEVEQFLSSVQKYVRSKGVYQPESSSIAFTFVEMFRPSAEGAIRQAVEYSSKMRSYGRRLLERKASESTSITPGGDKMTYEWKLPSITPEAPTLNYLSALSIPKQAHLLLRKLATQYGDPRVKFGKMNFDIPAHAGDLAMGYSPDEIIGVKELLLGAPWKKLESDGLIRDDGRGFFNITAEGFKVAEKPGAGLVATEIVSALAFLHRDFRDYGHYFREHKLKEAVAAAFERYENCLNQIRDASKKNGVKSAAGYPLVYKLFAEGNLKRPYPELGPTDSAKAAYEQGLAGMLAGGISWIRNAFTHEKHNLPDMTPQEALELLFVASYLMRMVDLASATR